MSLPAGTLDGLLPEIFPKTQGTTVAEGSAFQQAFSVTDPGVVEFDWNFLTDETPPEQTRSDFLFWDLAGVGHGILAHARLQPSDFQGSGSPFANEMGYRTVQINVPSAGTYTLTVGVADVQDPLGTPAA
jgi:hypothetical protein